MLEVLGFVALTGISAYSAREIKNSVKAGMGKGNAKQTSDYKRRKAAAKKKGRR